MFSVNFAKFVRTRFLKKKYIGNTKTLEIQKDLQRATQKITLKMRLKSFLGDLVYLYVKTRTL